MSSQPPNLPTSPWHLILLVFSPSRLGNHCNEPQKDHLKISKISKFQSTKQKKTNVSFQKAVFFKMRQRNIFLTKRQNSMVVSACELNLGCSQANLRKRRQTLHPSNGRNRPRWCFFFPKRKLSQELVVVGQGASNGKWRNFPASHLATVTKIWPLGPLPTSSLSLLTANPNNARFFVFDYDLQIIQYDPYIICTMFDLSQYWVTFDDPSSDVNQNDALEVW